jgi:hypothetical protein
MAGVAIKVVSPGAPQGGLEVIKCSVPASLTAWDALSAAGPGTIFVAVTKLAEDGSGNTEAARICLYNVIDVVGT